MDPKKGNGLIWYGIRYNVASRCSTTSVDLRSPRANLERLLPSSGPQAWVRYRREQSREYKDFVFKKS